MYVQRFEGVSTQEAHTRRSSNIAMELKQVRFSVKKKDEIALPETEHFAVRPGIGQEFSIGYSAKHLFVVCNQINTRQKCGSWTLTKQYLCRDPKFRHSTNNQSHTWHIARCATLSQCKGRVAMLLVGGRRWKHILH